MTENRSPFDAIFAAARAAEPTEDDVRAILARAADDAPRARRWFPRVSWSSAVALAVLAAMGTGTIGAFATGALPLPDRPGRLADLPPVQRASLPAPAALTERVGALRRPPVAADRDAAARRAAETSHSGPVYEDGVRFIGRSPLGERMYLVPISDTSEARDPHGRADAITASNTIALVVQGRFGGIGMTQPRPLPSILSPRAGVMTAESPVVGPQFEALAAAPDVPASLKRGNWLTDIVPDGVATVRLTWNDGSSTDFPVHDNVVLAHTDRELGGCEVTWLDGTGVPMGQPVSPPS